MHDEPHAHDDSHTPGEAADAHHHEHCADHHQGHSHDHHHHDDHHHHVHDHDHDHGAPRRPIITRGRIVGLLVVAALVALVWRTFYFVDETEYVFVTQFGDPVRLHVEPGLGIKMPYQSPRRLDRRLRMYDPPGREILTEDKENLNVDWYVCWRIPDRPFAESRSDAAARATDSTTDSDESRDSTATAAGDEAIEHFVLRFVQTLGNAELAEQRLEERIQAAIAAEISRTPFGRLVSLDPGELEIESLERRVTDQVRENAADQFGIEVVDVRLKRLNYPESVKPDVFAEIRSERDRVARQYEAEGESLKTQISSLAELHSAQIMAQAEREAASIRAEGQAQAIAILNAAHRQDPEFYELLKTLETYRAMLDERTTVVLSAESELLHLLTRGLPQLAPSLSSDPSVSEEVPDTAGASDEDSATSGNGASQP